MYEAVPWGHEVHPFGNQLHGGWANRRLTVLYHLNSDGVWAAVNKTYSTDFSRNKIISRRFPYLVVTLFRRREMQQDVMGPIPQGEAPGDSYGCEYFDIATGEDPPDMDTSIEDIYGDMVFMSRSTESFPANATISLSTFLTLSGAYFLKKRCSCSAVNSCTSSGAP